MGVYVKFVVPNSHNLSLVPPISQSIAPKFYLACCFAGATKDRSASDGALRAGRWVFACTCMPQPNLHEDGAFLFGRVRYQNDLVQCCLKNNLQHHHAGILSANFQFWDNSVSRPTHGFQDQTKAMAVEAKVPRPSFTKGLVIGILSYIYPKWTYPRNISDSDLYIYIICMVT